MLSLTKLRSRVYCLRVDDPYELAMLCLRYSEFKESPNPRFHKPFTIVEYMSWYARTQSDDGNFTYPIDWSGWNISLDDIKRVIDAGIPDPNHYDALMRGIHGMISSAETEPSYIIAVSGSESDVTAHELTHAMYYVDDAYKKAVHVEYMNTSPLLMKHLRDSLVESGYSWNVTDDEIQAYITTGEADMFDGISSDELDDLRQRLRKLHRRNFSAFLPNVSLQRNAQCNGYCNEPTPCDGTLFNTGKAGSKPDRIPQGSENGTVSDQHNKP